MAWKFLQNLTIFFGTAEYVLFIHSRMHRWKILSAKKTILNKIIGKARGVIMPHNLVKAIKDIMIIKYNPLSKAREED